MTGANANWSGLTTTSPEFLAVNPQGQIPALADGDLVLTESLAITLYLARKYGGALGPQSDVETALMEQWALFAATSVETPALEMFYPIADGRDKTPDGAALVAVNAEKLRRPLGRLQTWLADHLPRRRPLYRGRHQHRRMCPLCAGQHRPSRRIPGRQGLARPLPGPPRVQGDVGRRLTEPA